MELHAGHHMVVQLLGLNVNLDTLMMTWLVAALVIIVTVAATRGRSSSRQDFRTPWKSSSKLARSVQGNVGAEIRPGRFGLADDVPVHPLRQRIGHAAESACPGFADE